MNGAEPLPREGALEAGPGAEAAAADVLVRVAGGLEDGAAGVEPAGEEPPANAAVEAKGVDAAAGAGAGPELRVLLGEVVEEVFVDAALVGGLVPGDEGVFEDVPEDEDEGHYGNGGGEVVFD